MEEGLANRSTSAAMTSRKMGAFAIPIAKMDTMESALSAGRNALITSKILVLTA